MPIYEYECLECGAHFDRFQRFNDPQPVVCPNGHSQVHRLLSQPTIIFKGKGFYATDHGRNGRATSSSSGRRDKKTAPISGADEPKVTTKTSDADSDKEAPA